MSTMWASTLVMVNGLSYLSSQVSRMTVCSTNPANVAQAIGSSGNIFLAGATTANISTPQSTTNGVVIAVSSMSSLAVTSSGVARCVVLVADTSELLYITTCTTRAMTTSDTVSIPSWNIRIADPTSS